jgi:AraC-like DNA-binding protein
VVITVYNNFDLMRNLALPAQWTMRGSDLEQMRAWMKIVIRDFRHREPHVSLKIQGLTQAIFGLSWPHLTSQSLSTSIHSDLPQWLSQVMFRITQDPSCSIATLARESGFSQAQFRRLFHQHVGSAPRDYLTTKRLEKACNYLLHSDFSLREIASILGWRDTAHFSRIFATAYGIPPSQYRFQRRNREPLETN